MPYFFPLLGIVFIALKLHGTITWPWVWVTAPLWGGALLVVLTFIAAIIIAALVAGTSGPTFRR